MANNIGLDFGTTYSVISYLKNITYDDSGKINKYDLETAQFQEGGSSSCIDSLVAVNARGREYFGLNARSKMNSCDLTVYKGFKMLLSKSKMDIEERGYIAPYTPENVTEKYISKMLNNYSTQYLNGGSIDKLVVGVPEIWFNDPESVNAREKLRDIVQRNEKVKNVQLVSEPALACAYFIDNYKKNNKKKYVGHLLLIDYGGGTLDIALCKVEDKDTSSEITVLHRTGVGSNDDGVGFGGVLFLETVIDLALENADFAHDEIIKNSEYYKCVHDLEGALMGDDGEIEDEFSAAYESFENMEEPFARVTYNERNCSITYGMLALAYKNVIHDCLEKNLKKMIDYMETNEINFRINGRDDFKIALVGGFCNFYLTRHQIENTPGIELVLDMDRRYEDGIYNSRDCEKAIAYGAALVANDIISIKYTVPYTLSIVDSKEENGRIVPGDERCIIIRSKTEMTPGKPEMAKNEDGTDKFFAGNQIPFLRIDYDSGMYTIKRPAIALNLPSRNIYKIGFSFDMSSTLFFHLIDMGPLNETFDEKNPGKSLEPIRLTDINGLLGGFSELKKGE